MAKNENQRAKRSISWTYFDVLDTVVKKAKCQICGTIVMYSGSSTNLTRHLERHHSAKYLALINDNTTVNENTIETFLTTTENTKNSKYPTESARSKRITKKIAYMIAEDLQPFSVVEDSGFCSLVSILDPRYAMPTRRTVTDCLLHLYDEQRRIVQQELTSGAIIHITTDMWTDTKKCLSYNAVTCHFLNSNMCLKSFNLKTSYFPLRHTAENLTEDLKSTLKEWSIRDKVQNIVSDNAANISLAIRNGGWFHLPCYAHTLNLIVTDSLKIIELQPFLEKIRKIVHIFKSSTSAASSLKKYQENLHLTPKTLKKEIPTRWNSTLYMLQSVQELKSILPAVLSSLDIKDIPTILYNDWKTMEKLINILQPFEIATREMSAEEYVSASKIIPMSKCLHTEISTILDIEIVNAVKRSLCVQLAKRLPKYEDMPVLLLATFLDPRFKHLAFTAEDKVNKCKKIILSKIEGVSIDLQYNENKTQNTTEIDANNIQDDKDDQSKLWKSFDKKLINQKVQQTNVECLIELQRYIAFPVICRKNDPLEWWKQNENFPRLKILAKYYLSLPATSVPCERVFSKAGLIISEKRSKLSTSMVEKMVFLNMNLKKLNT